MTDRAPSRPSAKSAQRFVLCILLAAASAAGARAPGGTDLYGDPTPAGAVRLGTSRLREGQIVSRVAFSDDGRILASIGAAQGLSEVCLWDAATGRLLKRIRAGTGVWDFALLRGGKRMVTVGPGGLRVIEVATGKVRRSVFVLKAGGPVNLAPLHRIHQGYPFHVAASPDGKVCLATIGSERDTWAIDPAGGYALYKLHDVELAVFSPDGKAFAAAGPMFRRVIGKDWVAGKAKIHLYIHDAATGRRTHRIDSAGARPTVPAFSPDGKLVAWQAGLTPEGAARIDLVDVRTGKAVKQFIAPAPPIPEMGGIMGVRGNLAFSPDGKLLAGPCFDGTVRLWNVAEGVEIRKLGSTGKYLAFSPDGRTLAVGTTHIVQLWDVATGKRRFADAPNQGGIASVRFAPDGRTVATACEDRTVRLWDAATGRPTGTLTGHGSNLCSVAFSPDGGTLVSTAYDRTARTWDLASGKEKARLERANKRPRFAAFLSGGRRVCVAGHPTHALWDAGSGKILCEWTGRMHGITSAAVSAPAGLLAVACGDGHTLCVWRADTGTELLARRTGSQDSMRRVCFTALGDVLAYATDRKVVLVETCTGKTFIEIDRPAGAKRGEGATALSPDGRVVATVSGGHGIALLSAVTGKQIGRLPGHRAWVRALRFSPDGGKLASTCNDTTCLVWDVRKLRDRQVGATQPADVRATSGLWEALRGDAAAAAYRAMWTLVSLGDKGVSILAPHLKPAARPDAALVARLIRDLAADRYSTREQASARLRAMGSSIAPALRDALERTNSDEARQRLQTLIASSEKDLVTSPGALGAMRAVGVLARVRGPKARRLLEALAAGAPGAARTRRAKAALLRSARAPSSRPTTSAAERQAPT